MSTNDLRVVIRTPSSLLLDTTASELEVEDQLGRFTVVAGGDPALAALVPSELTVRHADGSELRVQISWGSLTAVGNQARLIVESAEIVRVDAMRMAV
jgi:F0F1-type ATP synthase epsilon subunit